MEDRWRKARQIKQGLAFAKWNQKFQLTSKYLASFEELEAVEAGILEEASSKILADANPNLLTLVTSENLSE